MDRNYLHHRSFDKYQNYEGNQIFLTKRKREEESPNYGRIKKRRKYEIQRDEEDNKGFKKYYQNEYSSNSNRRKMNFYNKRGERYNNYYWKRNLQQTHQFRHHNHFFNKGNQSNENRYYNHNRYDFHGSRNNYDQEKTENSKFSTPTRYRQLKEKYMSKIGDTPQRIAFKQKKLKEELEKIREKEKEKEINPIIFEGKPNYYSNSVQNENYLLYNQEKEIKDGETLKLSENMEENEVSDIIIKRKKDYFEVPRIDIPQIPSMKLPHNSQKKQENVEEEPKLKHQSQNIQYLNPDPPQIEMQKYQKKKMTMMYQNPYFNQVMQQRMFYPFYSYPQTTGQGAFQQERIQMVYPFLQNPQYQQFYQAPLQQVQIVPNQFSKKEENVQKKNQN